MKTVKPIQRLIDELQNLPSIGPKSAARLTYFLLRAPKERGQNLAEAILNLKEQTKTCEICFNVADSTPCEVCADNNRDHNVIMVVEEPMDVVAVERTGKFNGVYHVLGGVINPPAGIGPEELRIAELLKRLSAVVPPIREVILATNPTTEGEATAMYIAKQLRNLGTEQLRNLKITRIARGLPTGGDLEYADQTTLVKSLEGRVEY
ncbi:MAG: recombination protein RecR [Candidatus Cloacimonetes bacterium]|nr:recombination protein RecR [Candidatus Cloacimonadota bacterium]